MAESNDSNVKTQSTAELLRHFMDRWTGLDARLRGVDALLEGVHATETDSRLQAAAKLTSEAIELLADLVGTVDEASLRLARGEAMLAPG